jgi:ATP-dependent Clp protease ATP-binding subunit ClpA/ATP-dependent Clp protease ATP-binding subunit ClpC
LLGQLSRDDAPKTRIGLVQPPSGGLQVLPDVGTNLTMRAINDELPRVRSREPYRTRLNQRLRGAGRRAIVLVGRSGVGKTSLVHQLVRDMLEADGYSEHRNLNRCRELWSVTGRRIIAGMSYAGQWEERCLQLLDDLERRRILLCVPDIQAWGRIGQTVSSERCLADFFRGPVARGEAPIIAEATPEAWQRLEADAPAFANLFSVVDVREPPVSETVGILMQRVRLLEEAGGVAFGPESLRTILELSESLYATRAFPGKALELVEALASDTTAGQGAVGPDSVFRVASERTGIPQAVLEDERSLSFEELRAQFESYVMGQREAVDAVVDVVLRIKSGLTEPRRPYDVMLFCGPTGTGKTELARCLSAYLYGGEGRLVRFDMSEFAGPDAAGRLMGDRRDPDGLLTSAVRRQPFSVVLLDEIEKAHPSILNLLLQVFDEGRLTDASGRVADFSHAVIVMTSNLGARKSQPVGFGEDAAAVVHDMKAAVEEFFAPELFNRIDHIVGFGPLSPEVARAIASREVERLLARHGLLERRIFARATPAVLEHIVNDGFDKRDGARSLKRYLDREVGNLMSEAIARGGRAHMRMFYVYRDGGGFQLYENVLREAEMVGESTLTPMMDASHEQLREELVEARDYARELQESERLAEISQRVRDYLSDFNEGDSEVADEIYTIEVLRDSLDGYVESLDRLLGAEQWDDAHLRELELMDGTTLHGRESEGTGAEVLSVFSRWAMPRGPVPPSRDQAMLLVAESRHLARALDGVEEPSRHGATITLSVVGAADAGARFETENSGLLVWIAQSIATGRGTLEGLAGTVGDEVHEMTLMAVLVSAPRELVISVSGLGIYDWLRADHGCHVREALGSTTEVVRVEVRPGVSDARAALEERIAAREAFARALDTGAEQLPDNPDDLLPVLRTYRWEDPVGRQRGRAEVEDYRLAWAGTMAAGSFHEVATRMRTLSQSIQE